MFKKIRLNSTSEFREFCNLESAMHWAMELYSETSTSEYRASLVGKAIELYCGWMYRPFNGYLRNGVEGYCNCPISSHVDSMKCLIEEIHAHPLSESLVTYRYISKSYFEFLCSQNKQWFHFKKSFLEKGFCSTTLCPQEYRALHKDDDYSQNLLLKLYIPKGFSCLYVAFCARRRHEQELLLPPGCKFLIFDKTDSVIHARLKSQSLPTVVLDETATPLHSYKVVHYK